MGINETLTEDWRDGNQIPDTDGIEEMCQELQRCNLLYYPILSNFHIQVFRISGSWPQTLTISSRSQGWFTNSPSHSPLETPYNSGDRWKWPLHTSQDLSNYCQLLACYRLLFHVCRMSFHLQAGGFFPHWVFLMCQSWRPWPLFILFILFHTYSVTTDHIP